MSRASSLDWRTIQTTGPEIKINGITVQSATPAAEVRPLKNERVEVIKPKRETVRARVTAYCPCRRCCGPHAKGLTKLETNAWRRGVAADWRCWPPGTVLYIEGYGEVTVDDEGGKIKGRNRFDVRMTYHWEARQWGDPTIEVVVLSKPGE